MLDRLEDFPACIPHPRPVTSVALLSGGQDSAVTLALALANSERVLAVSFDYGQRHRVELRCAQVIADFFRVEHLILSVRALAEIGNSALLSSRPDAIGSAHPQAPDLPASFVPGRNGLFMQLAAAAGYARGAALLWGGWCQTDYSGYPDCRAEFLQAQERALQIGLGRQDLTVCAPLLHQSKAETFRIARRLGETIEEVVLEHTMTCYRGDRSQRHPWGYGCADCPACGIRARGFAEYQAHPAL